MAEFIIAVDIGTQGTKAVLFDKNMKAVADAFEDSVLIQPEPGTLWQEADDIYGSVQRTIRSLMQQSLAIPKDIKVIGIDSQMAGIMGIGADGEAVTSYDSWLDTRCEPYVAFMRNKCGKLITEITGGPVTYTHGPKILWWKYERPEAYKKISKFVLPHGYVTGKMCGLTAKDATFDYTCLQYSGFGDNKHLCWSEDLLDLFEIDKTKMAKIVSPSEVIGYTTEKFAQSCSLIAGIPVVAGAGDTAASIMGAGTFEQGDLLDVAGTASVLCSMVKEYVPDTEYETLTMMRSPIGDSWYPLAYINGGGLCLRWFRDNFTGNPPVSYDNLSGEASGINAGSDGIIFIPHFTGRVLPSNTELKGSYFGLSFLHTRAHLFRSIMEGISYEYAYYLQILKKLYPEVVFDHMKSFGGGAKSDLFLSIKSDVLGVSVDSFETSDTALIGIAVVAGIGVHLFKDYKKPILAAAKKRHTFECNEINNQVYKTNIENYLKLIDKIS